MGTHFNVNAYSDATTITTLVEGKIRVGNSLHEQLLFPGQQSVLTEAGIMVNTVKVEQFIAWTRGLFDFNNQTRYLVFV